MLAQALVERGLLDSFVSSVWNALTRLDYYIGEGNAQWVLIGLAVVMAFIFFKPKR
jgi:hypothetical protein